MTHANLTLSVEFCALYIHTKDFKGFGGFTGALRPVRRKFQNLKYIILVARVTLGRGSKLSTFRTFSAQCLVLIGPGEKGLSLDARASPCIPAPIKLGA